MTSDFDFIDMKLSQPEKENKIQYILSQISEILSDKELINENFKAYTMPLRETQRERVLEKARKLISEEMSDSLPEYVNRLFALNGYIYRTLDQSTGNFFVDLENPYDTIEFNIDEFLKESGIDPQPDEKAQKEEKVISEHDSKMQMDVKEAMQKYDEEKKRELEEMAKKDLGEKLFKSDLDNKENFLDGSYYPSLRLFYGALQGLQHIIMGGPTTNPNASEVSVLQNHFSFPNIRYSAETIQKIKDLAENMQEVFNALPDISDLSVPSKLRKKKELQYAVKELPKDPLDVTFGNDSGCCIFVPEKLNELQNGYSVPYFLSSPEVRLFGVYRKQGEKEQRMGFVLAFETETKEGKKILACNSLELSRMGIAGGMKTVSELPDYVESWLVDYPNQNRYSGATMGSHGYNTAYNFSSEKGEGVKEKLLYKGSTHGFYSDIFQREHPKDGDRVLVTREDSCYWLWKDSSQQPS